MTTPNKHMTLVQTVQIGLIHLAVALILLPLGSTLNRIMITEMALPATLVAVLLALRNLTSPLRIWFGRLSDTHPLGGLHRTWYILLGVAVMAVGLILSTSAIFTIPTHGLWGILATFLAFGLIGFGLNATTPLYMAVVTEQAGETERPRIVAFMFILLGVGMVVASMVLGRVLQPFSEGRLYGSITFIAAIAFLLTLIGLWRVEKKRQGVTRQAETETRQVRELLLRNKEVLRFFLYLVLTFVAAEGQDVLLEPYGGTIFGMTPGATASLTGILRGGFLITLIASAMVVNRWGPKRIASLGIVVSAAGLAMISFSGVAAIQPLFMLGILSLGLGTGALTIANLTLMMQMCDSRCAGVYLGTWGFAQSLSIAVAALLGGILRDVMLGVAGNELVSYVSVFGLETVLFIAALPVLWGLSVSRFQETTARLAPIDALASVTD